MNRYLKILFLLCVFFLPRSKAQDFLQEYHKGLTDYRKGLFKEAVEHLSKALEMDGDNFDVLINRGASYLDIGMIDEAILDFENANKERKDVASYYLACAYSMKNDPAKSIEYLEAHLKSRFKLPQSSIRLEKKFDPIRNSKQWIELWKQDWYNNKELTKEEITYLNKQEKHFEALELEDKLIKKYKKDHSLYILRGETYVALKNYRAAESNFSDAIKLNKRNDEYYIKRGIAYLEMGKSKDALKDFNDAIKLSDDNIDLYLLKARVLNDMGKYDLSLENLMNYFEIIPDNTDALFLCGEVFFNNGQLKESIDYFTKVLDTNHSKAPFFISRANSYFEDKQYRKALEDYTQALDLDPKNPMIYLQRGNSRLRLGQYKGACLDWEKADRMGSLEAKKNIAQFCK